VGHNWAIDCQPLETAARELGTTGRKLRAFCDARALPVYWAGGDVVRMDLLRPLFGEPDNMAATRTTVPAAPAGQLEIVQAGAILAVTDIEPHPLNPRRQFDGLVELGRSLREQGQMQALLVRKLEPGRWQLLEGERRLRAARKAGLEFLRADVVECDDVTALEVVGRVNIEREQFDPIAEARWLADLMAETGKSQRQLADHLKRTIPGRNWSQTWIAHRVRLLDLPRWWREQLQAGGLTETHARALFHYVDCPAILDAVQKWVQELRNTGQDLPAVAMWGRTVEGIVEEVTLPAVPGQFSSVVGTDGYRVYVECLLTRKQIETHADDLQLIECRLWGQKQLRCLNRELWWKLQRERERARKKQQQAQAGPEADQSTNKDKTDKAAHVLQQRLVRHRTAVLRQKLVALEPSPPELVRLLLWAATFNGQEWSTELAAAVRDAGCTVQTEAWGWVQVAATLTTVPDEKLPTVAVQALRGWLERSESDLQVPQLATMLGLQVDDDWRVSADFLQLFTNDQLRALARKRWKISADQLGTAATKGQLVARILEIDQTAARPLECPPELLQPEKHARRLVNAKGV